MLRRLTDIFSERFRVASCSKVLSFSPRLPHSKYSSRSVVVISSPLAHIFRYGIRQACPDSSVMHSVAETATAAPKAVGIILLGARLPVDGYRPRSAQLRRHQVQPYVIPTPQRKPIVRTRPDPQPRPIVCPSTAEADGRYSEGSQTTFWPSHPMAWDSPSSLGGAESRSAGHYFPCDRPAPIDTLCCVMDTAFPRSPLRTSTTLLPSSPILT